MSQKIFRQRKLVTIPTASAAGTYTETVTTDNSYNHLIGVMVQEISTGTLTSVAFGLKDTDKGETIEDLNDSRNWIASTGVGQSDRVKPIGRYVKNSNLQILVETPATTDGAAKYEFVFVLTNKTPEEGAA